MRNRLLLELMVRGGMRVGEVLKLTTENVIDQKLHIVNYDSSEPLAKLCEDHGAEPEIKKVEGSSVGIRRIAGKTESPTQTNINSENEGGGRGRKAGEIHLRYELHLQSTVRTEPGHY